MDLSGAANLDWAESGLAALDPGDLPQTAQGQRRLAVVLGASRALGDAAARDPWVLDALDDVRLPDPSRPLATAEADALPDLHRRGLFLIATRDLTGELDTDQAARELSHLADAVLARSHDLAYSMLHGPSDVRLAVMAMGKLGGQELNYVSDIDVIFVHDGEQQPALQLAQQIMTLAGSCYAVDAGLRPEGRSGVLSRTVASHAEYHQRWGRTWELQALVKMRHAAGAPELAAALDDALRPLVWPPVRGQHAVEEIQRMKGDVERSRPVRRDGVRQLKLAPGGLRDIEFAVQLLQLVHGPADVTLRHAGTLPGLQALAAGGYIDDGDAHLFGDAYRFLRTIEHRLQLWALRRTHTLPEAEQDMQRLAYILGFRDLRFRRAVDEFRHELRRVRGGVRRLHEQLFFRPLLATVAGWEPAQRLQAGAGEGDQDATAAAAGGLDRDAASLRLQALGFARPGRALNDVEAMTSGPGRTARQLRVVLPAMLEALAGSPDPDEGLRALRDLAQAMTGRPGFLRLIRDNPSNAAMLAFVLGHGPRLARWFVQQPEALQLCADRASLRAAPTTDSSVATAIRVARRGGGTGGTEALRRHARRSLLRTAVRSITTDADVQQVGRELTGLADGLVAASVDTASANEASSNAASSSAASSSAASSDSGSATRLGVIGLGRYGAAELSFSSDLDLIFIHRGDPVVAERMATSAIAMLDASSPGGRSLRPDTGLRPEGRSGPLSRSVESHRAYYHRWAEPWELFAMTQARMVAGDQDLGGALIEGLEDRVYSADDRRLTALRQMKARLEAERGTGTRPGPPSDANIKLGPGGLSDIEWTVQVLRATHGADVAGLRAPGTLRGVDMLQQAELIGISDAMYLRDAWQLFSEIRNALFLLGERHTDRLPASPERRVQLAGLLRRGGRQALEEAVARSRRRVRRVFERHVLS